MFKKIDTTMDDRLNYEEFKNALPIMKKWGLSEDQYVYRYVDPNFVDRQNNTAKGNSKSSANLENDHSPDSVTVSAMFGDDLLTPESFPDLKRMLERGHYDNSKIIQTGRVAAKDIGPGLNVSSKPLKGYSDEGLILIRFKIKDALRLGGRLYKDRGNVGGGNSAFWIEVPDTADGRAQSVPIEVVPE